MKPIQRAWRKGVRTLLQLIAGGGLTALVDALAHGLSPAWTAVILGAWTAVVTVLHNGAESAGMIPTILPTSPPQATEGAGL